MSRKFRLVLLAAAIITPGFMGCQGGSPIPLPAPALEIWFRKETFGANGFDIDLAHSFSPPLLLARVSDIRTFYDLQGPNAPRRVRKVTLTYWEWFKGSAVTGGPSGMVTFSTDTLRNGPAPAVPAGLGTFRVSILRHHFFYTGARISGERGQPPNTFDVGDSGVLADDGNGQGPSAGDVQWDASGRPIGTPIAMPPRLQGAGRLDQEGTFSGALTIEHKADWGQQSSAGGWVVEWGANREVSGLRVTVKGQPAYRVFPWTSTPSPQPQTHPPP
jgi:hypothetical protein